MRQARIVVDGRPYDVLVGTDDEGGRVVTVDGHTFRLGSVKESPTAPDRFLVHLDGHDHTVERLGLGTARIDETDSTFHLDSVTSGAGAGVVGKEGAEVRPPMPGKVVALRVQAGEVVEAGQVLLVLEAMKMQNEVTSPAAGVVTAVRVQPGQNVDTKDVLVVLGPPEGTTDREAEIPA